MNKLKMVFRRSLSSKYRADVDGLRAIAVLFVLGYHAFPAWVKGGFVGVDVFFVISGFLISGIILKALEDKTFSYADFYNRRIKRIFPALLTVLSVCLIFGWWALFSDEYASLGKHIASGAGFISNIILWREVGYFDVKSELKPLLHLWSLGIEEQFYIFWPVLLVFSYKKIRRPLLTICSFLLASFLIYFGGRLIGLDSATTFYIPITRFWELLMGSVLAYFAIYRGGIVALMSIQFGQTQRHKLISEVLACFGLLLIFASLLVIGKNQSLNRLGLLLPTLGTFSLIASGSQAWVNRHVLSNRLLVFIGLISYPLYLWHWPLLSFARRIESGNPSTEIRIAMLIVSFILAWLTYRLVEKPIRLSTHRFVSLGLCLMMLGVGITGLTVYLKNGFNFRFPAQEKLIQSMERGPMENEACRKLYGKDIGVSYCQMIGNTQKRIFIIGDSHSPAIYNAYNKTLNDSGYTVVNLGMGSCPFLIPEEYLKSKKLNQEEFLRRKACNTQLDKIISTVIIQQAEAVIMVNDGWDYQKDFFELGMRETLSRFPASTKIVWFTQNPQVPFDLKLCVNRPLLASYHSGRCYFPRAVFDEWTVGYAKIVFNLKKIYPNLTIIDPSLAICNTSECQVILNDTFLYNDRSHLSLFGGSYLASKLPINQFLLRPVH